MKKSAQTIWLEKPKSNYLPFAQMEASMNGSLSTSMEMKLEKFTSNQNGAL